MKITACEVSASVPCTRKPARARARSRVRCRGQSIVEFLLAVPVMFGLTLLLIRVNTVIQMGIVDQQYSRAQALSLAFNSNSYPELRFMPGQFHGKRMNQMIIGTAENAPPDDGSGGYTPLASTFKLGSKSPGASEDKGEVERRNNVRVRNTVTLCTQLNVVDVGGQKRPLLTVSGDRPYAAAGLWQYHEGVLGGMDFCYAPGVLYGGGG